MKRFKKILVVCQEDSQSELAVEQARVLAKANDAHITLINVVNFDDGELADILANACNRSSMDIETQLFDYHRRRLNHLADPLRAENISVASSLLIGIPFVEIIRAVLRENYDLIIKGSHPAKSNHRTLYPGLDMHLMRKCPCPVWITKTVMADGHPQILAAVDPEHHGNTEADNLNCTIIDISTSLCANIGGELHAVHAWHLQEEHALLNSSLMKTSAIEIRKIRKDKRARSAKALLELMVRYEDGPTTLNQHLLCGEPGHIISKFVKKNKVNLLVMGTVSRTDISGLFIGNTAEKILSRIRCSVLAVKPPDFRSPVKLHH